MTVSWSHSFALGLALCAVACTSDLYLGSVPEETEEQPDGAGGTDAATDAQSGCDPTFTDCETGCPVATLEACAEGTLSPECECLVPCETGMCVQCATEICEEGGTCVDARCQDPESQSDTTELEGL